VAPDLLARIDRALAELQALRAELVASMPVPDSRPFIMEVNPSVPAKTVPEFIA